MYLEPEELRSFLVLAEELHFRRASQRLFVSQPALSKQIQRLEEKVGGPLFARTRRKVALTEAARVLIPLAQRLLQQSAASFHLAREAAQGRAGTLRIGFGIATVSEILPRTILRFRRAYQHVELQMRDMSTPSQISELLEPHKCDADRCRSFHNLARWRQRASCGVDPKDHNVSGVLVCCQ